MQRHANKPNRKQARQQPPARLQELRHQLAQEAARLMAEGGLRDYRQAKLKAASRLGINDDGSLPRNSEVEEALRGYQRLFQRDSVAALRDRREAALQALEFFSAFDARLVGPVLEGTADARSPVELHLYCDDADEATRFLDQHGIPADTGSRQLRLDRERRGDFLTLLFSADDIAFELTVLPRDALRQAPLSAIEAKPMKRASAGQLRQMISDDTANRDRLGLG